VKSYLVGRLLLLPLSLIGVTLVVFCVMRVLPGDVVQAAAGTDSTVSAQQRATIRTALGLQRSLPEQYVRWLGDLVHFDLGKSLATRASIAPDVRSRFPVTAELGLLALLVSAALGLPAGVLSALFRDRPVDYVIRLLSLACLAIPLFLIQSLVRNFVLPKYFGWLPPPGYVNFWSDPAKNLAQIWLPVLLLGYTLSGLTARVTRTSMLDVLNDDYVRTARAKGLNETAVVVRHAMRNALLPVLALMTIQLGLLLSGSVITETIFSLPGLGRYVVDAIQARDYTVVQSVVLVIAVLYVVLNFGADLLYARIDPRIGAG
jgi:peptide/nickel transport system permease protein